MESTLTNNNQNNVIDLVSRQRWSTTQQQEAAQHQSAENTQTHPIGEQIIRLVPETDGLEVLYCNDEDGEELYGLKILCWALRANGEVVAMIPWLESVSACVDLNTEDTGFFAGYYDPLSDHIFEEPPLHKSLELETGVEFFKSRSARSEPTSNLEHDFSKVVMQEIADTLGTHVATWHPNEQHIELSEVYSWQLLSSGEIRPMLVNPDRVGHMPVRPGDSCLDALDDSPYQYFFQHNVAQKLKEEDPATVEALSALVAATLP